MCAKLSRTTVQCLIEEGFRPFPKEEPFILYCNIRAWRSITGYREFRNWKTRKCVCAAMPSLPAISYEENRTLRAVIHKTRISVNKGIVYFGSRDDEPLEGLEAMLAYKGIDDFIGVEKTLQRHIAALEYGKELRGETPRKSDEDLQHV